HRDVMPVEIDHEEAVFVVLARAADIGLAEHADLHRFPLASEHGQDRQRDCDNTVYDRVIGSAATARRAHAHPCARSSSLAKALATRYAARARVFPVMPGVSYTSCAES